MEKEYCSHKRHDVEMTSDIKNAYQTVKHSKIVICTSLAFRGVQKEYTFKMAVVPMEGGVVDKQNSKGSLFYLCVCIPPAALLCVILF